MHWQIEHLVFVAYLDSLFTESRESPAREVAPLRAVPETLNRLHAQAMREHARPSALLLRDGATWTPTPDWRLDRQVIRLALSLRERLRVEPGQRVALVSELRPEWLIADLAALGLGAVSVAIDPRLERQELADALEDAEPRVTFVSPAAQRMLESLDGRAPPHGQLVTLGPAAGGGIAFHELLDQGGTLDTPERAQSYREHARGIGPERPAVRHYRKAAPGAWDVVEWSQGEVIERLRAGWLRERARPGDLAYLCDPTVAPAARLALYAFLGDGCTTTALAPVGPVQGDLATLHPAKIVAPAALFEAVARAAVARVDERPGSPRGWLSHAPGLAQFSRARRGQRAMREALGGRARWIGSTEPLDSALAERLGTVTTVQPVPN
jgi:long-chain acyl-CoA synthetase